MWKWQQRWRWERLSALVTLLIVTLAMLRATQQAWLSDDAFVTMRYCDNVLAGDGPVYNVGERTEGYTHFLWFLLLTAGRALVSKRDIWWRIWRSPPTSGLWLCSCGFRPSRFQAVEACGGSRWRHSDGRCTPTHSSMRAVGSRRCSSSSGS
jgi:hypothetical protein